MGEKLLQRIQIKKRKIEMVSFNHHTLTWLMGEEAKEIWKVMII
jgi:hypothetical protein